MTDQSKERHIRGILGQSMDKDADGPTNALKRPKPLSRRSKQAIYTTVGLSLPIRAPPTLFESQTIAKLKEQLIDSASNGLRTGEVRSVPVVMNGSQRPLVHDCLLDILLASTDPILKLLVNENRFLPLLHDWINLYAVQTGHDWHDILVKILRLVTRLPLKNTDKRTLKTAFKRLVGTGWTEGIRTEAKKLVDQWETQEKTMPMQTSSSVSSSAFSRIFSNPTKRKVGKALFAESQSANRFTGRKKRKHIPGPLHSGEILRERSWSGLSTPCLFEVDSQTKTQLPKLIRVDSLPLSVSKAVNGVRIERSLASRQSDASPELMHSMTTAPSDVNFYHEMRTVYAQQRSAKETDQISTSSGVQLQTEWKKPLTLEATTQAKIESSEMKQQRERERQTPYVDSSLVFSSIDEGVGESKLSETVPLIPYFPKNEQQYQEQKAVLVSAGVRNPSHLDRSIAELELETSTISNQMTATFSRQG